MTLKSNKEGRDRWGFVNMPKIKMERERDRGIKEIYLDGTGNVPLARNHAGHSPSNTNPNRD